MSSVRRSSPSSPLVDGARGGLLKDDNQTRSANIAPSITSTTSGSAGGTRDSSPDDNHRALGAGSPLPAQVESFASPPVRNTFIHFDLDGDEDDDDAPLSLHRCASAPGNLGSFTLETDFAPIGIVRASTGEVTASERMIWDHKHANCRPCAYFLFKPDGCRHGPDCEFCHLCELGEKRRRKKAFKGMRQVAEHEGAMRSWSFLG
mmetsp:Transcript_8880/g.22894  ORF Transcript_8880/g.22894 Transcript_8880/m.22894 type:complete len:205 (+) Transcript_8880:130-744(+)